MEGELGGRWAVMFLVAISTVVNLTDSSVKI